MELKEVRDQFFLESLFISSWDFNCFEINKNVLKILIRHSEDTYKFYSVFFMLSKLITKNSVCSCARLSGLSKCDVRRSLVEVLLEIKAPSTHYAGQRNCFLSETHLMFFQLLYSGEFRNVTITSHFGLVFEENSDREIKRLSRRYRFQSVSTHTKTQTDNKFICID